MFIILLSLLLIEFMRAYVGSLPTEDNCIANNINGNLPLSEAKLLYNTTNQIDCYCEQQKLKDFINNNDLANYCRDFINKNTKAYFIRFSVSFFIVFVNYLLTHIINKLSKFERFNTVTKRRLHVLTRIFIMMFFNTSISLLLSKTLFMQNNLGFNQKYIDFTRNWYVDVGNIIIITMLVNIFSPHLLVLLINYPYKTCKRRICHKSYRSQYELNKLFIGPSFDIANSLSQILTVIFSCYMYSGGMPLLNIICLLALIATY